MQPGSIPILYGLVYYSTIVYRDHALHLMYWSYWDHCKLLNSRFARPLSHVSCITPLIHSDSFPDGCPCSCPSLPELFINPSIWKPGSQTFGDNVSQLVIGVNVLHLNLISQVLCEEVILDCNILGPDSLC